MTWAEGILFESLGGVTQWGLQTGFVVSVLILFVLVVRRPVARYFGAHAAYALWALPLIRVFMPEINVPFLRKFSPQKQNLSNSLYTPETTVALPPPTILETADTHVTFATEGSEVILALSGSSLIPLTVIMTSLWLGIAVLWLGFQLYKQRSFAKSILNESKFPSSDLQTQIIKAVSTVGLRRAPLVKLHNNISGPMVSGVWTPFILLPSDFEDRFEPEQQHFALVHEMTHVKRKDLWVAMASLILRALFWPNPLIHYAAHKMRSDQEASCDASVLKRTGGKKVTHSYAQTLVHAAKTISKRGASAPLGLALTNKSKDDSNINDPFNKETNA